jgi:hypothetical protein
MFDKSLDVTLKEWTFRDESTGKSLKASINRYKDGPLKFQLGPRTYITKSGDERATKVGRISKEEFQWLLDISDEVLDVFSDNEGDSLEKEIENFDISNDD